MFHALHSRATRAAKTLHKRNSIEAHLSGLLEPQVGNQENSRIDMVNAKSSAVNGNGTEPSTFGDTGTPDQSENMTVAKSHIIDPLGDLPFHVASDADAKVDTFSSELFEELHGNRQASDIPKWEKVFAFIFINMIPWLPIVLVAVMCAVWWLRPILVAYVIFWLTDKSHVRLGRPMRFVKSIALWSTAASHFPILSRAEAPLDPSKQYIFGYHPHGLLGLGALTTFLSPARMFSVNFPGIDVRLLTLKVNFFYPIYRELALSMGLCSVDRGTCKYLLNHGKSIAIVIGGMEESKHARPYANKLYLKKRLGFARLALQTGASLVPVYGFGENDYIDIHDPPPGSLIEKLQMLVERTLGIALPIVYGPAGALLYPYSRPITVVFGRPIHVDKVENPSNELVEALHSLYTQELVALFQKYKSLYAPLSGDLTIT